MSLNQYDVIFTYNYDKLKIAFGEKFIEEWMSPTGFNDKLCFQEKARRLIPNTTGLFSNAKSLHQ